MMLTQDTILNAGLDFAMAFGEDWLKPIQSRLSKMFPNLTTQELDDYNTICRGVMKEGHEFIYKSLSAFANEGKKVDKSDVERALADFIRAKNPWVNKENMDRILSQGFYYAWKDGLC